MAAAPPPSTFFSDDPAADDPTPLGLFLHANATHTRKANTTTAATEMPAMPPSPIAAAAALVAPAVPEVSAVAVMVVPNVVLSWAATAARLRLAAALAAPEPDTT